VVQAATREFNPTLPQSVVDRALERDQAAASAEYLAQFRSDIESFVSREAVEVCVDVGVRELMPTERTKFFGFTDPSGGSGDSFALAIGHHERRGDLAVLDAVREVRPPFSPKDCVEEFARLLKSYRVTRVVGDRYAGEWPREEFASTGSRTRSAAREVGYLSRRLADDQFWPYSAARSSAPDRPAVQP
jgi:hypothetical protein